MKLAIAGKRAEVGLAKVPTDRRKDHHDVSEIRPSDEGLDALCAPMSDRDASQVIDGNSDRAITHCGTGIKVCIAAHKVPGMRATLTHETCSAERAALSNNAQVITMGARVVGTELAKAVADALLAQTPNSDAKGRSAGNVDAIDTVDAKYSRA